MAINIACVACVLAVFAGCASAQADQTEPPAILQAVHRILFYGDSLTDGSSYPDFVVNTLNREFPAAGYALLNSARAGDTAKDLRQRLQADVSERKPDLVIICIGTNDCNGKRPVADYRADLEFVVDAILREGAKVMLMTPSNFGDAEKDQRFQDYLAVIRDVAAKRKLVVADAYAEFKRGEKAGKEMLGGDGIHHGKDGFEGMGRAVLDGMGLTNVAIDTQVRPWPNLLLDWETSAPVENKQPYELEKAAGWKPFDRQAAIAKQPWWDAPFAARGGWMPFALGKPQGDMVAFGRTYYEAKQAGKAELQIGGSRPLVVWLNGKEVWRGGRPHGYHPDADRVIVDLQAGRNEFIAVSNFMVFIGVRDLP